MLEIRLYDEIELKNGQTGCVVDRFGEQDSGDEDLFVVDIGDSPKNWETIDVKRKDIARVIKSTV